MLGDSIDGLPVDTERRFGSLSRLYGTEGAARIRSAHVMVVGLGGVGSWAAEALARSGARALTLVDLDHLSESNVNRQVHALTETIGQAKVDAMRNRIAQINPDCRVLSVDEFASAENWLDLIDRATTLNGALDGVIDACDQVSAKVAIGAWALASAGGAPTISVGAAGGKRLAHLCDIENLAKVTHDPLLAAVRHRLRKHHHAPQQGRPMRLPCVFSREAVVSPQSPADALKAADGSLNCHGYGSVVSVTAAFGMCAAGWLLDQLASREMLQSKA